MGWLVDIWRLWSQKTGVRVDFVMAPFAETLKQVGSGKVDVHGGCFYSTERTEYLAFVAPLAKASEFALKPYSPDILKAKIDKAMGLGGSA